MTESGMSNLPGSSANSSGSAPTATRCSARSPTTLDDGVTLTMLPRMSLAAAYMSSICSNFSPRPSAIACWRRLESWPPGISWRVDPAGRRRQPGLERRVDPAGRLPVGLEVADRRRGRARSRAAEWSVAATSADSARLRGGAGHRGAWPRRPRRRPASIAASSVASWPPGVSWVCRCTGRSNRSRSARDQRARGRRAQQAGHVLDREHVRAGVDDPLGEREVVVERVELLVRVGQVAGVAERDLGDRRAGRAHRLDRRPHLLDVVERVEDPEDVDAGRRGLLRRRRR